MEIVIPPRAQHGPSTFRYTWDENGEVQQVTRVLDEGAIQPQRRPQRGRQTVQWPFQSVVSETEVSSDTAASAPIRPVTWQPKRLRDVDETSIEQDLIPDYVRNYIRGETPESVARRKRNGGKLGERGVDIAHQHRPHQSRAAEFEGFRDLNGTTSRLESSNGWSGDEEQRHILSGSGEKGKRGWRRLAVGWRAGVAINALLAFIILVVGVICLTVAVSRGSVAAGQSVIFTGSCTKASAINWGLQATINVLVVVLLAGANYVFQVLSSPTRTEVAVAHFRRQWLDIGIPSFRNLAHIQSTRTALAVGILFTAAFTQIIYNAVVFTSQTALDYKLVVASEAFLSGAAFSNDTSSNSGMLSRIDILSLQQQAIRGELANLTTTQFLQEFSGAFSSSFNAALLITNSNSPTNSLVQTSSASSSLSRYGASDGVANLALDRSAIRYCLAQRAGQQACEVSVNGPLLGAVALLNLISVVIIAAVLFKSSFEPLATLGDAIASFLREPDMSTRGCCLLSKTDVWQGRWGLDAAKYWLPRNHYWFRSPSLPRWMLAIFVWACLAGPTAAALAIALLADPTTRLSPFGVASPYTVVALPASTPDAAAALIAALPQILLFVLYLVTNALLSTYYLSHESSLFAVGSPRPLRVSADPEGTQLTSLYLTLPRPISWALLVVFAGLGFLLSQTFFVVGIRLSDLSISATTPQRTEITAVALGLSGLASLLLLGLLVVLGIAVVALGFRRAPPAALVNGRPVGNPMALPSGSCSAVISARCHARAGERGLWRRNVVWGTVSEGVGMDVSHCTFTAGMASQVDVSRNYA
ncbi:hypothetical protein QBC47DRAFT_226724 [Echria macrotheca]|uniref:DUF6536 domain-containing protein n=1 Tax=Echria macrotheca TaxID=438768 RepID=A0AAJ0BCP4_9PEZI|nr:hypothetical protein QBC47DRAFT_226724 [Echria macrotheca]